MAPSSKQQIRKDVPVAASIGVTKNDTAFKLKKEIGKGAATARAGRRSKKYEDPTQHISKLREDIVGCLRDSQVQVLMVVADSYSQKSLLLPRYIGDSVGPSKKVACAYFSAHAGAMAAQLPPDLGIPTTVTLTGRHSHTSLEFMSADFLLQKMVKGDRDLTSYSAVYVDAAHHRTLTTDILFGSLLPLLVRRGPTLRLVLGVTPSAAHEAEKFFAFFGHHCSTRTLVLPNTPPPPPMISYIDPPGEGDSGEFILSAILELHRSEETYGSILLFLGRDCVDRAARYVQRRIEESSNPKDKTLRVIPLHTGDDWEVHGIQLPRPPGRCLFISSPKVPDASPQIHGVSYVIDPGKATRGGRVRRVSQQSANERAAHLRSADPRLGAPKCFRLYPESVFRDEMPRTTTPEILTYNAQELSVALGTMKRLGVTDPWTFNFIDPPPAKTLAYAVELTVPLPDLSQLNLGEL